MATHAGSSLKASHALEPLNTARLREDRAIARALRIIENRAKQPGPAMDGFLAAGNWFRLQLSELPYEAFAVGWLDNRNRVIAFEVLFTGSIASATVHTREVVRAALAHNAAAAIFSHNHPSGDPTPSKADVAMTAELTRALALVEVRVLDHLVVTPTATCHVPLGLHIPSMPANEPRRARRKPLAAVAQP